MQYIKANEVELLSTLKQKRPRQDIIALRVFHYGGEIFLICLQ